MKILILVLSIMFAANSVVAQQYNMIGDRSVSSPFDTFGEKNTYNEPNNATPDKKETKQNAANETANKSASEPVKAPLAEHKELMGSRSYSSTKELYSTVNTGKNNQQIDNTPARHDMIGERSVSTVSQLYAQNNAPQTEQKGTATIPADNATTADTAPTDNATSDNATTLNTPSAVTTDETFAADNSTGTTNWLNKLFDTENSGQKLWAAVNYSWISPQSSDVSGYLKNAFGISAGYHLNDYFGVELGFRTMSGKQSSQWLDASNVSQSSESKIEMYDFSALATARYTFRIWKGDLMPYVGVGAGFVSATKKDTVHVNGLVSESSKNSSGYAIIGRAGVRYGIGMFIIGANVQYTYSRVSYEKEYDFSAISYGLEAGFRF